MKEAAVACEVAVAVAATEEVPTAASDAKDKPVEVVVHNGDSMVATPVSAVIADAENTPPAAAPADNGEPKVERKVSTQRYSYKEGQ